MNYSKKITFIIPCYNSEYYLKICINSLYSQDLNLEDFQIVAIDDNSSDNTNRILKHYKSLYNNIFIIEHKNNKGQGISRNEGLENAIGKYIWFIDSDDFINPHYLSNLINTLEENDLDLLHFQYNWVNEKNEYLKEINASNTPLNSIPCTGLDFINKTGSEFWRSFNFTVWSSIYKNEFLKDRGIYFNDMKYYEDLVFTLKALVNVNRMLVLNNNPYNYRIHNNSLMRISEKSIQGEYIYYSCIRCGFNIWSLGNDFKQIDKHISSMLQNVRIYRMNKITKPLILSKTKEKFIFFSLINQDHISEFYIVLLRPLNKLLLKQQKVTLILTAVISPFLRYLKKKRNNKRHSFLRKTG